MNRMKRMTINLLGAGLLLGVTAARAEEQAPAAFDEKAAATAAHIERLATMPWTELREEFKTPYPPPSWPKGDKELEERFKPPYGEIGASGGRMGPVRRELQERKERMYEDLTKRQGEVYKQIDDGTVDQAFPTVFDQFVLCDWLTQYARGRQCDPYFAARRKEVLGEAGMEQYAAEQRRVEAAIKKYWDEDRQEYEAVVKANDKDPENARLKQAAEEGEGGPRSWMMLHHGPFAPHVAVLTRERQVCKYKMGWHGKEWLLVGPDPAPDATLPRIDESGRKPGTAKTVDLGNGVKLQLVWIPAGEFMMGSPTNEPVREIFERLHRVKLTKGFWMGKYEVTQEQWQRVMGNNPSWFTKAGPKAPVETVRLDQAQKFMRKLGEMTAGKAGGAGGKFRLPTEAEWEWACRAGTTTALYNGKMTIKGANNSPELGAIAWYTGNSGVDYEGGLLSALWEDKEQEHHSAGTHPVGQKKPNAWGLYDMLGNVWEWCEGKYVPYPSQAVTDPMGQGEGQSVVRGGAWNSYVRLCRSASRDWVYSPGLWRNAMIGFRVAMDEPAAAAAEKAK